MTRTIARGELKRHCPNIDHCDAMLSLAIYSQERIILKEKKKRGEKSDSYRSMDIAIKVKTLAHIVRTAMNWEILQ